MRHEAVLRREGFMLVAGIDEVGRGALAGPVVAAACILNPLRVPRGLDDSKRLTTRAREQLAESLRVSCRAWAVAAVSASVVDRIGIVAATTRAMVSAARKLRMKPDALLVDAMTLPIPLEQRALIHGDQRSASIAAASILAKVWRDAWMARAAQRVPGFGFERHVGYGTAAHIAAIRAQGLSPLHRRTFVASALAHART